MSWEFEWKRTKSFTFFFGFVMTLVNGRDLIHSSSKAQSTVENTDSFTVAVMSTLMRSIYMWRIVFFT